MPGVVAWRFTFVSPRTLTSPTKLPHMCWKKGKGWSALTACWLEKSAVSAQSEWIVLYVAFCTVMAISRQKESRSRDYVLLLSNDSRVLYSAQYHRQHCTLQIFEQFGAQYMQNLDDKHLIFWTVFKSAATASCFKGSITKYIESTALQCWPNIAEALAEVWCLFGSVRKSLRFWQSKLWRFSDVIGKYTLTKSSDPVILLGVKWNWNIMGFFQSLS